MENVAAIAPSCKGTVPPPPAGISVRIRRRKTPAPESIVIPGGVRKRRRIAEPLPVTRETAEPALAKGLRKDARGRHAELCELIAELTESHPFEFEGQTWATEGFTLEAWAKAAGMPLRSFKRMLKVPPIVTETTGRPKRTLIRVGEPVALDDAGVPLRKAQNALSKRWREHLDADERRRTREGVAAGPVRTAGRDYGLLCGLAADLPGGWQVRIFEHTLRHWDYFCGFARLELKIAEELGGGAADLTSQDVLENPLLITARKLAMQGKTPFQNRYYKHPNLGLMRLLPHVMVDVFTADAQSTGRDWPGRIVFPD